MTDYYVLSPLGSHNAGDVLSFSPEQIGAGVDITHLTSIGALRVATPLLAPPLAPTLATAATGGTVAAGVYTVKVSYVTASGETTPSPSATITTSGAISTLTVNSPAPATGATGWYAYVSQVGGSTMTCQQTSPTSIATNLVLTAPPTSSGPAPRGTNTSGEAARSVPAQIQASHAPPGVGVFAINGSPVNGPAGSYANIAAYGSVGIDASVSPPAFYTNLGTIASPTWTAAGGAYAGVTSDGLDGIAVEGGVQAASFAAGLMPGAGADILDLEDGVGGIYLDYDALNGRFRVGGQLLIQTIGGVSPEVSFVGVGGHSDIDIAQDIDGALKIAGKLVVSTGLGVFGTAAPASPRTLAQSVITAMTDANAKTAVQALANTLADMGALILT